LKEGQQERLVGQEKGGEGGGFQGKKVQVEKVWTLILPNKQKLLIPRLLDTVKPFTPSC
jgi:hypothetical protein